MDSINQNQAEENHADLDGSPAVKKNQGTRGSSPVVLLLHRRIDGAECDPPNDSARKLTMPVTYGF